jgi:hypothetical protein
MAPPVSESGEGEIVADFRAHRSDGWVMAPRARRGKEADVGGEYVGRRVCGELGRGGTSGPARFSFSFFFLLSFFLNFQLNSNMNVNFVHKSNIQNKHTSIVVFY